MLDRTWYPQLDVYDALRRMCLLLIEWDQQKPSRERLYIADFFLANPTKLHGVRMQSTVRSKFRELKIAKPNKTFVKYPFSPVLYHKMEGFQISALQKMISKGMLDLENLKDDKLVLSTLGVETASKIGLTSASEKILLPFLINDLFPTNRISTHDVRNATGLRRAST